MITRYLRLLGEEVISVTGSDAHGTPILLAAEQNATEPKEFALQKHEEFVSILEQWSIEFDNYTITTTPEHAEFVRQFYRDLILQNAIERRITEQYFCTDCDRFLPDRFVIGTCPSCLTDQARGDQCSNDRCNIPLQPFDIIEPRCSICKAIPRIQSTEHWFFKLKDYSAKIFEFLETTSHIPDAFRSEAVSYVKRGLQNRALTRDLSWGIPADEVFGCEEPKVFYVWAEDVLGYISASIPVLERRGQDWREVWRDVKSVYCLGKDNLFYHGIWFPALQSAASLDYSLPTVLSITNFIQFNGQGFSKSKNIGIWADDALNYADAEYWRFYLIVTRPENRDTNFTWEQFSDIINSQLVNTIGNLILRSCTLFHKYGLGGIAGTELKYPINREFVTEIQSQIDEIIRTINSFALKDSLELTIVLARRINNHLENTRPWKATLPEQQQEIFSVLYWALTQLAELVSPVIPRIGRKIKQQLGLDASHRYFRPDYGTIDPPDTIPDIHFFLDKVDLDTILAKITRDHTTIKPTEFLS